MTLDIQGLPQVYQSRLRTIEQQAKGERGNNGKLDSLKEIIDAIESLEDTPKLQADFIASISIDIASFPENTPELKKIKTLLLKVDREQNNNGRIDTLNEIKAVRSALGIEENYLLADNFSWHGKSTKPITFVPFSTAQYQPYSGRYSQTNQRLQGFLLGHNGQTKPNATVTYRIDGNNATGMYHVYDDIPSHIRNAAGGTSEGQVLFFNYMSLASILNGSNQNMMNAYNYLRYYMSPCDGVESPNMPDSEFLKMNYCPPGLNQWLIQMGTTQNGTALFGVNNGYEIYDPSVKETPYRPSIAQDPLTHKADINRTLQSDVNSYKFSSASDADMWEINGYYWATMFGQHDFNPDIQKKMSSFIETHSLEDVTLKTGPWHGTIIFGRYFGGNVREKWGWTDSGSEIMTGYQDPAAIFILSGMKESGQSANIVSFEAAAQKEYTTRYGIDGPFMPVYIEKGTKAEKQRGYTGFGWKSADPNTHWMGFQFRTFAHLAHYYYLTGDKQALDVLSRFTKWIDSNTKDGLLLPSSLNSYEHDGEGKRHASGPQGSIESWAYSPNNYGLYAQGLALMASRSGNKDYKDKTETILDYLQKHQQPSGNFPEPEDGVTYGFHQAEVGIAFSLYQLLLEQK